MRTHRETDSVGARNDIVRLRSQLDIGRPASSGMPLRSQLGHVSDGPPAPRRSPSSSVGRRPRSKLSGPIVIDDGPNAASPAEQISHILTRNAVRVMDLFRQWDTDQSGCISKAEFRAAMSALGLTAGKDAVDGLFDSWDASGDGSIDFKELNRLLRRSDVHVDMASPDPPHDRRPSSASGFTRASVPAKGSLPPPPFELLPTPPAATTHSLARAKRQFDAHVEEAAARVHPPVLFERITVAGWHGIAGLACAPGAAPATLHLEHSETPKPVMLSARPSQSGFDLSEPLAAAPRRALRPGSAPPAASRSHGGARGPPAAAAAAYFYGSVAPRGGNGGGGGGGGGEAAAPPAPPPREEWPAWAAAAVDGAPADGAAGGSCLAAKAVLSSPRRAAPRAGSARRAAPPRAARWPEQSGRRAPRPPMTAPARVVKPAAVGATVVLLEPPARGGGRAALGAWMV